MIYLKKSQNLLFFFYLSYIVFSVITVYYKPHGVADNIHTQKLSINLAGDVVENPIQNMESASSCWLVCDKFYLSSLQFPGRIAIRTQKLMVVNRRLIRG